MPDHHDLLSKPIPRPGRLSQMPQVGERAGFARTLTDGDVSMFIGATWDINPVHTDDRYCREHHFGRRIVPGLWTASLCTHIGGLWAFVAQDAAFHFRLPVYVGDTITTVAEITETDPSRAWIRADVWAFNESGAEVLRRKVGGFLPDELRSMEPIAPFPTGNSSTAWTGWRPDCAGAELRRAIAYAFWGKTRSSTWSCSAHAPSWGRWPIRSTGA